MQKIYAIVCLMLCCFLTIPALAQQKVTGTVSDSNNEPLPGVTVRVKDIKNRATSTNIDGDYTLFLPGDGKEYTIEVSYVGYVSQTRKLKPNQSEKINFYLKESEVNLDMVVITATRTPKLLSNSPTITRVITENEIKKVDATNIAELLQSEIPGLEFSYSMGQQVSLNMQGFGGNSILFLVDGERMAGETLDNVDYSRLNLDNVERVEIVKGAASSLYGSNAVGGVINIISKKPTEPWTMNVNSRLATHNVQRHGGSVGFKTGKVSNTLNVQYNSADPHNMRRTDGAYSQIYGNQSWNIKDRLRYIVNRQLELTGHLGYSFRERESQPTSNDRYRGYSGGIKGEYTFNSQNNLELSYVFDQYDKSEYMKITKSDVRDYSNVQHSVRALYNHSFDKEKILTIGGDYMRDYLMSYQFENNGSQKQYVADVFAQFDWTPVERFNVIAGLRYDYFSNNDINRVSPKLGLMYKWNDFTLRGSYAAGFRAPTLKEMHMVFDMASVFMIYGNPDLKSESSNNFSISGEYTKSYYSASVTGYYNLVSNRISTVWNQSLNGMQYTNTDKIKVMGIDANASTKLPCGFGARISYTYIHENIKRGSPVVADTRPHTATTRIEYGKNWKNYGFNVTLSGRFLSKLNSFEYTSTTSYEETEAVTYPSYSMWKLSLSQSVWKGVNVTLAVDNLFNYVPSYYYSSSPYTTGSTFSAGVSLDIDKLFK